MEIRIMRLPEVKARTGLGKSTIYQMASLGDFPPKVKLGRRSVGWDAAQIEGWLQSRQRIGGTA